MNINELFGSQLQEFFTSILIVFASFFDFIKTIFGIEILPDEEDDGE